MSVHRGAPYRREARPCGPHRRGPHRRETRRLQLDGRGASPGRLDGRRRFRPP